MDIWRAAEILNRRKWLILFSMIVAALLTFGATRLTGSRWMATVRLLSPEPSTLAGMADKTAKDTSRPTKEDIQTQEAVYAAVITSREVVEPAYKKLKLTLPSGDRIFEEIEFEALGPRLYELRVFNSKPAQSEAIANALADGFVQRNHDLATQQSQKVVRLLGNQLRRAQAELAGARRQYQSYSDRHHFLGSPKDELRTTLAEIEAGRGKRGQVQEELAATTARLEGAERELIKLGPSAHGARPSSPARQAKLAEELARVDAEIAVLEPRYGSEYPELKTALATRAALRVRLGSAAEEEQNAADRAEKAGLRAALQKTAADLRDRISGLRAQAGALDAAITNARARVQRTRDLDDPYGSLATEVAARAEVCAGLETRLNSAQMALDVAERQNPIVIMAGVNDLNPPVNVTAGRTRKLILLAALCALLGASALIIGLDSVDRRLKTVHEAEKSLPTRVLATIPQPAAPLGYASLARVAELDPQSLPAEAYRFLALHLLNTHGARIRSLMVLSAKAEQGSTTSISNLAITLAQAGKRVILVDTNTRTPEVHQVFDLANDYGFTDLLRDSGVSSLEKALRPTSVDNLRVITSGTPTENVWELFRSENLRALSQRLHETADYVLYDTPSAAIFTDALNLAPIVDASFLCVRALEAPSGAEQQLIELIKQANVALLGSVLCDVPVSLVAAYGNYQSYYPPAHRSPMAGPVSPNNGGEMAARARPLIDMLEYPHTGPESNGSSAHGHGKGKGILK